MLGASASQICTLLKNLSLADGSRPVNLNNPYMRLLTWMVAIAVAIRVTFELIGPVLPYLICGIVLVAIARLVNWYRGRW